MNYIKCYISYKVVNLLLKNKNNVFFLLVEDPTYTDLFLCNSWDIKWFIKDFKDILTVKDQPSYQQLLLEYDN